MMNFGAMNDRYYEPQHDGAWDAFVDYCESNGLDTDDVDFDQWVEDQMEARDESRAEAQMEARRDRDYDY